MMVVMLILMIATASAAVSIRSTQAELQAAGQERVGVQARQASEAAMMSMITYVDMLGAGGKLAEEWLKWEALPAPEMYRYGEPNIQSATGHVAARKGVRIWADALAAVRQTNEVAPVNNPVSGGDELGSFGPRQAYGFPTDPGDAAHDVGFAVDFTDCVRAPTGSTAGTVVDGGSGSTPVPIQFFCVLTARARIQLPTAGTVRSWTFGGQTYAQDPSAKEHDSRATILVPEFYSVPGS